MVNPSSVATSTMVPPIVPSSNLGGHQYSWLPSGEEKSRQMSGNREAIHELVTAFSMIDLEELISGIEVISAGQ